MRLLPSKPLIISCLDCSNSLLIVSVHSRWSALLMVVRGTLSNTNLIMELICLNTPMMSVWDENPNPHNQQGPAGSHPWLPLLAHLSPLPLAIQAPATLAHISPSRVSPFCPSGLHSTECSSTCQLGNACSAFRPQLDHHFLGAAFPVFCEQVKSPR